jgi:uncharacterized protein (DUF4415 family)
MPKKQPNAFLIDDDNPKWTAEDFKRAKPVPAAIVSAMEEARKKIGRPRSAAPKVNITLRLHPDVVAMLRGTGRGYNALAEQILRDALSGRSKPRHAATGRIIVRHSNPATGRKRA